MPDDFQPRVKIKKMFHAGMLITEEEMQQFSENFAIETHLIMYIAHLEDLKQESSIFKRTRGRTEQRPKLMSKKQKNMRGAISWSLEIYKSCLCLSSINILNITNS